MITLSTRRDNQTSSLTQRFGRASLAIFLYQASPCYVSSYGLPVESLLWRNTGGTNGFPEILVPPGSNPGLSKQILQFTAGVVAWFTEEQIDLRSAQQNVERVIIEHSKV